MRSKALVVRHSVDAMIPGSGLSTVVGYGKGDVQPGPGSVCVRARGFMYVSAQPASHHSERTACRLQGLLPIRGPSGWQGSIRRTTPQRLLHPVRISQLSTVVSQYSIHIIRQFRLVSNAVRPSNTPLLCNLHKRWLWVNEQSSYCCRWIMNFQYCLCLYIN